MKRYLIYYVFTGGTCEGVDGFRLTVSASSKVQARSRATLWAQKRDLLNNFKLESLEWVRS